MASCSIYKFICCSSHINKRSKNMTPNFYIHFSLPHIFIYICLCECSTSRRLLTFALLLYEVVNVFSIDWCLRTALACSSHTQICTKWFNAQSSSALPAPRQPAAIVAPATCQVNCPGDKICHPLSPLSLVLYLCTCLTTRWAMAASVVGVKLKCLLADIWVQATGSYIQTHGDVARRFISVSVNSNSENQWKWTSTSVHSYLYIHIYAIANMLMVCLWCGCTCGT